MTNGSPASAALRQLRDLLQDGSLAALTDGQLLERFVRRGAAAETAFAALVERHGPMVMQVCRALLRDVHGAEDAFQATFLVLARRAGSIREPDLLANWLYGVAHRTARKARAHAMRRRSREVSEANMGALDTLGREEPHDLRVDQREQTALVHEELARLPEKERAAVVFCCLEELTIDEAARRLRCTPGAVRGRLAQARARLRARLVRRGVAVPIAVIAAVLSARSSAAAVPPALGAATTRAALGFTSGAASAGVVWMASSVSRIMLLSELRVPVAAVLVVAALAAGVAGWARAGNRVGRPGVRQAASTRAEPLADQRALLEGMDWYVLGVDPAHRTVSLSDLPMQQGARSLSIVNAGEVLGPSGLTLRGVPVAADARVTIDGRAARLDSVQFGMRVSVVLAPGRFVLSEIRSAERPHGGASVCTLEAVDVARRTIDVSLSEPRLKLGGLRVPDGAALSRLDAIPDGPIGFGDLTFEDLRPGMPVALVFETEGDGRFVVRSLTAARGKPREERADDRSQ